MEDLKKQFAKALSWDSAHVSFEDAVSDVPYEMVHIRPEGVPYSIWELVYHCRIAQWDILEYSKNHAHNSPKWPEEYWPEENNPSKSDWEDTIRAYLSELAEMNHYIADPGTDLFSPFPNGSGHTLLREILLLADHTAYHTGQIVLVRKLLNNWHK